MPVENSEHRAPTHTKNITNCFMVFQNLDRRSLLTDILPIIGTNLNLQRLYTEFSELLDSA